MTDKIIVVDLEATCWDGEIPKGEVNEIIEIGICILDKNTGDISKSQGVLVKPTLSTVSEFCTELTTITQELLDSEGVSFSEAIEILKEDYNPSKYMWASYGYYDFNMMKKECDRKRVDNPLATSPTRHINVKELFKEVEDLRRPVGMKKALKRLKIPLEGTHHRGVDDARNIAKILYHCIK